jgi:ABC-type phosphate transport system substrate-binding protein
MPSAFQIDVEDILIVAHRQSPVNNLTLEEARALFLGGQEPEFEVWVFAAGEDIQQAFRNLVMGGRNVSATAKVAGSPQEMADILNTQRNAVGVLPRHWKTGDSREVFVAATVPVLGLTKGEPAGILREVLSCLQD